jgi:hypothetical protein
MSNGRKETGKVHHLLVKVSDEPDVPDWPDRLAKMLEAAESIVMGAKAFKEAADNTRWSVDALDICVQIIDLVLEGHDGNSILDLVEDIKAIEEVSICQKSKSSSRKAR